MNRLQAELHRLYLPDDAVAASGRTRALVLQVTGPGAWTEIGRVWQAVQADLQLPAPGICVNGSDGYQLWFSLAEPVAVQEAFAWLDALRAHYLPGLAPTRVALAPGRQGEPQQLPRTPPCECGPERWSAFIAADLAPLFSEDPWLDLTPSAEAQAELLARLQAMKLADWRAAFERLRPAPADGAGSSVGAPQAPHPSAGAQRDPRRFLLDVMNDPAIDLHLRIEAAKALLDAPETRGKG